MRKSNLFGVVAVLIAFIIAMPSIAYAEFASEQMQSACSMYDNYDLSGAVETARNAEELGGSSAWTMIEFAVLMALTAQFPNGMGGVSPEDQFGAIYIAWGEALFGFCHAT